MHTKLYLTATEQKFFSALPQKLREGWSTEAEKLTYQDTNERRQVRLDLMELDDGRFERAVIKCGPTCSEKDLERLMGAINLKDLSERDLWEVCFALGPTAMGYIISKLLMDAKDDKQLEGAMAFSHLRHELLISLLTK